MLYTVKEVSELSNVTIKTLHHYHKIGLLHPREVSEAGYRLYGMEELERLQEILFYREMDFSLDRIKTLFANKSDRLSILSEQQGLILGRQRRLDTIAQTLRKSIISIQEGTKLDNKEMFKGFNNEEDWNKALAEHNEHLEQTYDMEPMQAAPEDVPRLNEQAMEAMTFMNEMCASLREGVKHNDATVTNRIERHLAFMNEHGHPASAQDFAAQTQFFLQDEFHLKMLENQQTGLAYYLSAAAGAYAAVSQ
ncbi:MerR family transcriptional regulator [Paenibacillus sp. CCS19]|uniref:MerR family transcriptional regulator n=1 Tax=Paenibacillus sp. CCS19 TaxID=3158387 RepID=UPI002560411D|nr:MerR family transcriptional regulator [Paenibacillus cellulosilyticus]GMK42567.1 MerR family transcriptional regulator [Paenibacillus cellulosilyticus]